VSRARNLAAFTLTVQLAVSLAACEHIEASARTGHTQQVSEDGLTGRWLVPDVPAPGAPALLIVGNGVAPGFSTRLATAAMEGGVASLEVQAGDPGQALLWLGPKGKRLYVAATGEGLASVVSLAASGRVAGFVLFSPPAIPGSGNEPCLVIRGGEPASKQSGQQWQVSFPDLQAGHMLTPDDEHSVLELVVLWLRARADEH
jgi:hypothetical protein